jgi:hypothetical protein
LRYQTGRETALSAKLRELPAYVPGAPELRRGEEAPAAPIQARRT